MMRRRKRKGLASGGSSAAAAAEEEESGALSGAACSSERFTLVAANDGGVKVAGVAQQADLGHKNTRKTRWTRRGRSTQDKKAASS